MRTGNDLKWQAVLQAPAQQDWLRGNTDNMQEHDENAPPQRRQPMHARAPGVADPADSAAEAPATPQPAGSKTPRSTFKQRVAARMAELEATLRRDGTGLRSERQRPVTPPHGDGQPSDISSLSPVRQRLAYGDAGVSQGQPSSRSSSFNNAGSDVAQPAEELLQVQQELAGARAKLLAARAEAQRLQIAVAREHEARQVAERALMEAHAGVMPVSASHELALQEVDDLRRRLAAAEQAAETRRQSLLAEKAKAQNALGQLAIAREKVKMAQARTEQQRDAAATAAAQLAERDAECTAMQAQLDSLATVASAQGSGTAAASDLEAAEQELDAVRQECAGLRGQVQHLQTELAATRQQLKHAKAAQQQKTQPNMSSPVPEHANDGGGGRGGGGCGAEQVLPAEQAAELQAALAASQRQERRLRERVAELEQEASRARKAARAAEAALAKAQDAVAQQRARADNAERQLLSQALEMDELQQDAAAAARLAEEAAELRAVEATAQLHLAEATREVAALRAKLSAASGTAHAKADSLAEQHRELKQEQVARQQLQRALDRQEARMAQLTRALADRDAQLAAVKRDASSLREQKSAVESWLDD